MSHILILRPQPGAAATAERAAAIGLQPIIASLFEVRAVPWDAPEPSRFDGLLMTSANAARWGGSSLEAYRHLPAYTAGAASAAAASAAGFAHVVSGDGDGAAALGKAIEDRRSRLLHLAGREHVKLDHPLADITERIVYAAEAADALPGAAISALEGGAIVLVHSPRAARTFASLVDRENLDRSAMRLAMISPAAAQAAGSGWAAVAIAETLDDDALLAQALRLCNLAATQRPSQVSTDDE